MTPAAAAAARICRGLFATSCVLLMLSAPTITVWQVYVWLRYGYWPELPAAAGWVWLGLPFPEVKWLGVQKIIIWVLSQALSADLLVLGLIVFVWIWLSDRRS